MRAKRAMAAALLAVRCSERMNDVCSCEISFSTDIDSENDVELAASLARATGCSAEECDRIIASVRCAD